MKTLYLNIVSEFKKLFYIDNKRNAYFDYVRFLATIFLLITHSIIMDMDAMNITNKIIIFFCRFFSTITISCNVIFLMLSGALLLPYKEENIFMFYKKRFLKLLIPILIYYAFYMFTANQLHFLPPQGFKSYLIHFISGDTLEAPHMWILYQILAFYILCPFLRILLKNLSYKNLSILILLSFICIFLNVVLNYYLHINFVLSNPLNEIFVLPIYGYFLMQKETQEKYKKLIFILGFVSIIVVSLLCIWTNSYLQVSANTSPIAILLSAFFMEMLMPKNRRELKNNILSATLSKYSFSIILIHWFIISTITMHKLNIHTIHYNMLGIIPSVLTSLLFSFIFCFIIDNTIVAFVNFIINKFITIIINKKH